VLNREVLDPVPSSQDPVDALLVLSFGGPEGLDEVRPFLENVVRGRGVPPERLDAVEEHYRHFGGVSPLNARNRDLIAAVRERTELPVSFAPNRLRLLLALASIAGTVAFGAFLDATTDSTVPYPDAATTVLSLVAQLLLTRRHIDNWPVWIFGVNVPYIALYLYKGLALTAALQLVFIALSAMGWRRWLREARGGRADAAAPTPALERAA